MKRYLEKGEIVQKGDRIWFCVADDGDFYDVSPNLIGKKHDGKSQIIREVNKDR